MTKSSKRIMLRECPSLGSWLTATREARVAVSRGLGCGYTGTNGARARQRWGQSQAEVGPGSEDRKGQSASP